MQIVLTGPEKRKLELTLGTSGFSRKQSVTAVALFASFLAQCDVEKVEAEGSKTYWRNYMKKLLKRPKIEEKQCENSLYS